MNATWQQIIHFRESEFRCQCCGEAKMNMEFILLLDDLRHRVGMPLRVSSGYRCPWHNDKVSTTGFNGPHTTGRAVDLAIYGPDAFRVLTQASLGGWMRGIGVNQKGPLNKRFLHLDNLEEPDHPRPRIWSYA